MELKKTLEQHIAVFGESGSGKTVMVSSFYGATQHPEFAGTNHFRVSADSQDQHEDLYGNYLGMRDDSRLPMPDRFASTSFAFSVMIEASGEASQRSRPFDALRLVWHDYPGEWFQQDVSGPEEEARRIKTFRSLLSSDLAFVLVDGQKLIEHQGEEDLYLKRLLANIRNGLLRVKGEILENGEPLVQFPRIWMFALTKADLLPEFDVHNFRDLLIRKAAGDIKDLRNVVKGFIESPEATSVGEDFVLFSSAKFDSDRIELTERVGVDLILPMAARVPAKRQLWWASQQELAAKVATKFVNGSIPIAALLSNRAIGMLKVAGIPGRIAGVFGRVAIPKAVTAALGLGGDQLAKLHADQLAKKDYLAAALSEFEIDLADGEARRILFRRPE